VGPVRGSELDELIADSSIRSIRMVAWRDIDDPEAGGSELHAHRIASAWAGAGLTVTMRTSMVPNAPREVARDGYRALRRGGRYGVFPAVMAEGVRNGRRRDDALVEIWNGMPFFSPLWRRQPRLVFLHHVHGEMWDMVLSKGLARLGDILERRVAPPIYGRTTIMTLSDSSKEEIVERLHLREERVHVVPPGIEERFGPGGERSATPHVVAVGRLVPVKRYDLLIRQLAEVKRRVPTLTAEIIGEGYERVALETLRSDLGAEGWLSMPGRVSDDEQLAAYQRAWLVASSSLREGWGMTLTEAAACGTPAVATDIAGHRDAVRQGSSGLLVGSDAELAPAMTGLLVDDEERHRLGAGALDYAKTLTWERTAASAFELLAAEVR
jgi:glycosyltransferase involved in cell wall biosynthesis